jgi:hypothetical protein
MRYRKGCLNLSRERDDPVLRQLARSNCATRRQLFEFLQVSQTETSFKAFSWRLRRLVEHGLIRRQSIPEWPADEVYALSEHGVRRVESAGECFAASLFTGRTGKDAPTILHSLELNRIHLAFLQAGVLTEWVPEIAVYSENRLTATPYSKDYDAIMRLKMDGQVSDIALEYERTAKSEAEYADIACRIAQERRLSQFLYLTSNRHLLSFVSWQFRQSSRALYFGLVEDLYERQINMSVFTWASMRYIPLGCALKQMLAARCGVS